MTSLLLIVKVCIKSIIPDVPTEVVIQLQRQKFIVSKLFFDNADENVWYLSEEEQTYVSEDDLSNCIEEVKTKDMVPF
jgi:hypothetical protein